MFASVQTHSKNPKWEAQQWTGSRSKCTLLLLPRPVDSQGRATLTPNPVHSKGPGPGMSSSSPHTSEPPAGAPGPAQSRPRLIPPASLLAPLALHAELNQNSAVTHHLPTRTRWERHQLQRRIRVGAAEAKGGNLSWLQAAPRILLSNPQRQGPARFSQGREGCAAADPRKP